MSRSSRESIKKHKKPQSRSAGCKAYCCGCRLSVSSSEELENSNNSDRFPSISSIAHAMVQERLDQMIREKREARNHKEFRTIRREARREEKKFVIMMAMEKSSCDPREDFRESMKQMIVANQICEAKDLRRLLSHYVRMNSEEFRGVILEIYCKIKVERHELDEHEKIPAYCTDCRMLGHAVSVCYSHGKNPRPPKPKPVAPHPQEPVPTKAQKTQEGATPVFNPGPPPQL